MYGQSVIAAYISKNSKAEPAKTSGEWKRLRVKQPQYCFTYFLFQIISKYFPNNF